MNVTLYFCSKYIDGIQPEHEDELTLLFYCAQRKSAERLWKEKGLILSEVDKLLVKKIDDILEKEVRRPILEKAYVRCVKYDAPYWLLRKVHKALNMNEVEKGRITHGR